MCEILVNTQRQSGGAGEGGIIPPPHWQRDETQVNEQSPKATPYSIVMPYASQSRPLTNTPTA